VSFLVLQERVCLIFRSENEGLPIFRTLFKRLAIDQTGIRAWCDPVPGIELAGQALNKNAVAVMPKNQLGWYNSAIADDFQVQILETRIHTFWGRLETVPRAVGS
jgi:hypothetical protein